MMIKNVWAAFFSPVGTTKKTVKTIANQTAKGFSANLKEYDFTLPQNREDLPCFQKEDVVIFGTPVIAGRVPNVLLKFLGTLQGNGAFAVPIVLYGNRNYDDALIELRDILEKGGFHTIAAGAFIGQHSFSEILANGRPDESDLQVAFDFADAIVHKLQHTPVKSDSVQVDGVPFPYRGYYQPRDRQGNPVDIRKVKPVTNANCTECLICAASCPMGSISQTNVREITGICIKCNACVKKCPQKAKHFEDSSYLYHRKELEEGFTRRAKPEIFI